MTYVKTQLPTLKTHVVNLKRDAKDLSRDLQRLEVRGKLGSKTLYCSCHSNIKFISSRHRVIFSISQLRSNRRVSCLRNAIKFKTTHSRDS